MIKAYVYGNRTQLSPHFRSSEFQCKCGNCLLYTSDAADE